MAIPSWWRLFKHFVRFAASRTFCTAGSSRPTSTAMIAITTSSSISVKPRQRRSMRNKAIANPPQTTETNNEENAGWGKLLLAHAQANTPGAHSPQPSAILDPPHRLFIEVSHFFVEDFHTQRNMKPLRQYLVILVIRHWSSLVTGHSSFACRRMTNDQ